MAPVPNRLTPVLVISQSQSVAQLAPLDRTFTQPQLYTVQRWDTPELMAKTASE